MAIFKNSAPIVTNGLILYLDAANPQSYISGSAVWRDIITNTTGSLMNTFSFNNNNLTFTGAGGLMYLTSSRFNTIQENNSLTLSVWFRNSFAGEFKDIIGINKTTGVTSPFVIRQTNSNLLFYDTIVGSIRYNGLISSNSPRDIWINAVATYGNNQINTYYNSRISQTLSTSGNITSFSSNQFGTMDLGYGYFSGSLSCVSLYNRALSQEEVTQNYNAMKGRFNLI